MGENWLRQSLQNKFFPQYGVLTSVRTKRKPCNDFRKCRTISWDLPPSGYVIEYVLIHCVRIWALFVLHNSVSCYISHVWARSVKPNHKYLFFWAACSQSGSLEMLHRHKRIWPNIDNHRPYYDRETILRITINPSHGFYSVQKL